MSSGGEQLHRRPTAVRALWSHLARCRGLTCCARERVTLPGHGRVEMACPPGRASAVRPSAICSALRGVGGRAAAAAPHPPLRHGRRTARPPGRRAKRGPAPAVPQWGEGGKPAEANGRRTRGLAVRQRPKAPPAPARAKRVPTRRSRPPCRRPTAGRVCDPTEAEPAARCRCTQRLSSGRNADTRTQRPIGSAG